MAETDTLEALRTAEIAAQNDMFRKGGRDPIAALNATRAGINGKRLMTAGAREALDDTTGPAALLSKLYDFNDFTEDNDPNGERDFGIIQHAGHRFYWKIDYYDADYAFGSPDPTDREQTRRVLTILLASEY